ncbi:MAG: glycerophosphodiester phosphodiesterase [Clostridia bacterium]|nr:glycerophosphodiester phosphodiesterase [Clostridia bacterium]
MSITKLNILLFTENLYCNLFKSKFRRKTAIPENFTITCHAGSLGTKANSLESVKTAVDWGADIVEFDVSFRPDGTAVIIHDSSPSAKQGVLLEDALKIVASVNNCKINLDIKSTANLPEVDRLVKKHGLFERVFYTGVFEDWVDTVKNTSDIPYYLNHKITKEEATNDNCALEIINKAKELGAIGINSHYENATAEFCKNAHKNGLLVSLWTVNGIRDMAKVINTAPDNITTKKPDILKHFIK